MAANDRHRPRRRERVTVADRDAVVSVTEGGPGLSFMPPSTTTNVRPQGCDFTDKTDRA